MTAMKPISSSIVCLFDEVGEFGEQVGQFISGQLLCLLDDAIDRVFGFGFGDYLDGGIDCAVTKFAEVNVHDSVSL